MWARNRRFGRLRLSVDANKGSRRLGLVQFDHVAQQVPDVPAALAWWREMVPGAEVLYEDETWGLLEGGGARLAFVRAEEHPGHVAWRVGETELERLAAAHGAAVVTHRDGTRSFYLEGPGGQAVELIAYPDLLDEETE